MNNNNSLTLSDLSSFRVMNNDQIENWNVSHKNPSDDNKTLSNYTRNKCHLH